MAFRFIGFVLSAVGVDRRLKDDPDVSQVDLRLGMACVEIRLDTFFPYFAGTKFMYIWRKVLSFMASCMTMHKIEITSWWVGECVRFLFTSCEGSLNERVSAANE